MPVAGSYSNLLQQIERGITERIKLERQSAGPNARIPITINGKVVLPITEETFVVKVTNTRKESVHYLFNWSDLYNTAFYIDSDDDNQKCWYYFRSTTFKQSQLPPHSQFSYVAKQGKGLYELALPFSYSGMGLKEIMLGKDALDDYVHSLYIIRESLFATTRGKRMKLDTALRTKLQKGPFSFVPEKFTKCFTEWSKICECLFAEVGFVASEMDDAVRLSREEVQEKIRIMSRGEYLLTPIADYMGPLYALAAGQP